MAGQLTLDTKYYPHDFHITTVTPPIGTTGGAGIQFIPLLYADRNLVVDSIVLYIPTAVGAAATFTVYQISNTAVPVTSSIPATQTQMTDTTASFATGGTYPARSTLTVRATGTTANNIVPAGSTVWGVFSAAATAGMTVPISIQVRWRSQF